MVIAQRLVRKVCKHCGQQVSYSDDELKEIGLSQAVLDSTSKRTIFEVSDRGCAVCQHTGYLGRTAIVEVFGIDETVKIMIAKKASTVEIMQYMKEQGMFTLKDNGLFKVLEGVTTLDEVLRVTV